MITAASNQFSWGGEDVVGNKNRKI